ncbi:MAG: chorismate synthase [Chlamydiia bacterium]|nr:chorismate synthase [Chlamydiia bacterium]
MASNSFGTVFRMSTWGESHGPAIGVVIDGCPAGLAIRAEEVDAALARRRPGQPHTSPRNEPDSAQILSGVHDGYSTGAPISILIWNKDVDSSSYEALKDLYKPGHAQYTYLQKYGRYDYRGGGRASARETACRVAAGAIAKKLLSDAGVHTASWLSRLGGIQADGMAGEDWGQLELFCPDKAVLPQWRARLAELREAGDSVGGIVTATAWGLPAGWGDPVYEKLEAKLAAAMLSIPASKGFEIGEGFGAADLTGTQHNDLFYSTESGVALRSNHAGGTLGGISTGLPIKLRVPFKPTSSVRIPQETVSLEGEAALFATPASARHDPCVAIRAVPVVDAMLCLVLADCMLMARCARA